MHYFSVRRKRLAKWQGNAHRKRKEHASHTDTLLPSAPFSFQPMIIMAACECMKEEGEKTSQCFLHFPPALKYFAK